MKSLNVSRFILIYKFLTKNIKTGLDLFISCDTMIDICWVHFHLHRPNHMHVRWMSNFG